MERNTNEKLNAEKALVKTIADAGAAELIVNTGEGLLDTVTNNEIIREIPVLRTVIGLSKAGIGISNYLFSKKIIRFFEGAKISEKARQEFLLRIERDKKFEAKVGETLFLLLERLDDMEKPKFIGLFFAQFLEGRITFEEFVRLSRAMERAFLPDLSDLKKFADVGGVDDDQEHLFSEEAEVSLLNAGLIRISTDSDAPYLLISPIGDLMVEVLYGKPTPKRMLGDWVAENDTYRFDKSFITHKESNSTFGHYEFVGSNQIRFRRGSDFNSPEVILDVKFEQGAMKWNTTDGTEFLTWTR